MTEGLRTSILAARRAARALASLSGSDRSRLLEDIAATLAHDAVRARVLAANQLDVEHAREAARQGELGQALVDRLVLSSSKLDGLSSGLRQLANMPELVNRVELTRELDDALVLTRVTCPLGVLGVVFEARPDAVPQITGLAIKSGNAVVLKGGREAQRSNHALVEALQQVLAPHGIDPAAIVLLEGRAQVDEMLRQDDLIDLVVARGSSSFVRHVQDNTRIPVMGHAAGICHLYVHRSASPAMAAPMAVDAKCSYPAACNAIETLLWDEGAEAALDACVSALIGTGVELRGCEHTRARHPAIASAKPQDWDTEHGALVLGIKRVRDLDEALAHIEAHGSRHTEAIVAEDKSAAQRFLTDVDAAGVFHNASTRFADGYRYGLGAEVGISTDKLHARGPVGVDGLLSYRWLLRGRGQVTTDYGPGKRPFTHRDR